MSNDQPTERFDAQSGDAPTVRYESPGGMPPGGGTPPPSAGDPPAGPPDDPARKSRTAIIVLSVIGGMLLIAVVIALTLLFSRGSDELVPVPPTPSASATPSDAASPTPSADESEEPVPSVAPTTEPPPAIESPSFATFTAPSTVDCPSDGNDVQMIFSWSSADATTAWFGVQTTNAKAAPYEEVPTTATYPFQYSCSNDSQYYTVTLEDADGNLTHKTVTVTKN